ncbi:hypothetical protein BT69DRAFT_1318197 [Atractiella rhizophila]|nr:hypothetical protein BT69DRAFT_1318197 [Atractiella rhizophila]
MSSPSSSLFRLRLTHISVHMDEPPSQLAFLRQQVISPLLPTGETFDKLPVIRIYGATERGQRVAANVWGAFPYVYVPWPEGERIEVENVQRYIKKLGKSLNTAMSVSFQRAESTNGKKGKGKPKPNQNQYIAYIALIKAIPFYGYHVGYKYYLKIYYLNPKFRMRLMSILKSGRISLLHSASEGGGGTSKRHEQEVCEAHLPFELQWMVDFNLYGCGWMDVGDGAKLREPLPADEVYEGCPPSSFPLYTDATTPTPLRSRNPLSPSTSSTLEIDIHVSHILNRGLLAEREVHHDFGEYLTRNDDDGWAAKWREEKLVTSVRELWIEEGERRKVRGEDGSGSWGKRVAEEERPNATKPFISPSPHFVNAFHSLAQQSLAAYKQVNGMTTSPAFHDFLKPLVFEKSIPTAFQSVSSTWPEQWEKDRKEGCIWGIWGEGGWMGDGVELEAAKRRIDVARVEADEEDEEEMRQLEWFGTQAAGLWMKEGEDVEREDREGTAAAEKEWRRLQGDVEEEQVEEDKQAEVVGGDEGYPKRYERKIKQDTPLEDIRPEPKEQLKQQTPPSPEAPPVTPVKEKNDEEQSSPTVTSPFKAPHQNYFQPTRKRSSPLKSMSNMTSSSPMALGFQSDRVAVKDGNKRFGTQEQLDGFGRKKEGRLDRLLALARDDLQELAPLEPTLEPTLVIPEQQEDASGVVIPMSLAPESGRPRKVVRIMEPPSSTLSSEWSSQGAIKQVRTFGRLGKKSFQYSALPPPASHLLTTLESHKIRRKEYRNAFYGDEKDVPSREIEFGGHRFKIPGDGLKWLKEFEHAGGMNEPKCSPKKKKKPIGIKRWEFAKSPPTLTSLRAATRQKSLGPYFIPGKELAMETEWLLASQVVGPTQANAPKFSPLKGDENNRLQQHMGVLVVELHVETRGTLLPDPSEDEMRAIFYCYQTEAGFGEEANGLTTGCIAVSSPNLDLTNIALKNLIVVDNETELVNEFIDKMKEFDPEVVTGYEIQTMSWGYLMLRGKELGFNLVWELGRAQTNAVGRHASVTEDRWGYTHGSTLKIDGRHCLPLWRILRSDVALTRYTFENTAYHVLHKRVPKYSYAHLTQWYHSEEMEKVMRVFDYYLQKVNMVIEMLDEAEIVTRNAEFARIFGVDFLSVLNRGSQFKVESVMSRIVKPESFIMISPSREDVGKQNAAECIPLIMEPQSAFYKGPLVVLDFQSLYPSVMIAYNYCYSTCLGRTAVFKGKSKLGSTEINPPPGLLSLLRDDVNISPNGMIFVKSHVRKSLLSKMLSEILDTRVMVKGAMKAIKDDRAFLKMMNARQLGLKYIANVTYGYTSATFSGRMPCVEIADAIVQTGRDTLERSLSVIEGTPEWGAQVVYGDTDSLFVYLPGKTKEDALRIGNEIADHITSLNPYPVKLKFEKVYLPSILLAKKRYVGFKYESLQDTEPGFDAKGLEVIRRDGTPALQKMEEAAIKILFRTSDLSQVKAYVQSQWARFMAGELSPLDFFFAKEVRLGTYSENGVPPPGAVVASRKMQADPRAEPLFYERVPYIIAQSDVGNRQVDRALAPDEFMADRRNMVDINYYINNHFIKPLARLFNLVGADVESWWKDMPKQKRAIAGSEGDNSGRIKIDEHFVSSRCVVCEADAQTITNGLCQECASDPSAASFTLLNRLQRSTKRFEDIKSICRSCSRLPAQAEVACVNYDCPVFYSRKRAGWKVDEVTKHLQKTELTF